MTLKDFLDKYSLISGDVFKPTPERNITDEKMRNFASDISKLIVSNVDFGSDEIKRIGFTNTSGFTGLEINYTAILPTEYGAFLATFYVEDRVILYIESNQTNSHQAFLVAYLTKEAIKNNPLLIAPIGNILKEFTLTQTAVPAQVILTPDPYAKRKRYYIDPVTMPTDTFIQFYYDYGTATEEEILYDEFEIFFQAKATGQVRFATKGYDYYHANFNVTANNYYKLCATMLPKFTGGQTFVWATIQDVATPQNN